MAVIVILILVLIVVAVLLVRVCKHRAIGSSSSFSDKITSVNGSMTALQSPYGAQVAGKDTLNYSQSKRTNNVELRTEDLANKAGTSLGRPFLLCSCSI